MYIVTSAMMARVALSWNRYLELVSWCSLGGGEERVRGRAGGVACSPRCFLEICDVSSMFFT